MPTTEEMQAYYEKLKTVLDEGVALMGPDQLTGMMVTMLLRLPERHDVTVNKILGALFGGLSANMTSGLVDIQAVFDAVEQAEIDPAKVKQILAVFTKLISLFAVKRSG